MLTDPEACLVASDYHGGQFSALYALASTCTIDVYYEDGDYEDPRNWQPIDVLSEIQEEIDMGDDNPQLLALRQYVAHRVATTRVCFHAVHYA